MCINQYHQLYYYDPQVALWIYYWIQNLKDAAFINKIRSKQKEKKKGRKGVE